MECYSNHCFSHLCCFVIRVIAGPCRLLFLGFEFHGILVGHIVLFVVLKLGCHRNLELCYALVTNLCFFCFCFFIMSNALSMRICILPPLRQRLPPLGYAGGRRRMQVDFRHLCSIYGTIGHHYIFGCYGLCRMSFSFSRGRSIPLSLCPYCICIRMLIFPFSFPFYFVTGCVPVWFLCGLCYPMFMRHATTPNLVFL